MIVAFAAGGTTDFVARLIADKAKAALGQSIVVENKPGANGAIGADFVGEGRARRLHAVLLTAGALTINPSMRTDLPYDPVKDFAADRRRSRATPCCSRSTPRSGSTPRRR